MSPLRRDTLARVNSSRGVDGGFALDAPSALDAPLVARGNASGSPDGDETCVLAGAGGRAVAAGEAAAWGATCVACMDDCAVNQRRAAACHPPAPAAVSTGHHAHIS